MKPNFALNLSHEGITLLHRAQSGWLRVGEVSLDDPGLAEQLGLLRKTAADLESGGVTTKLVIPNTRILYTDVEAPGPQNSDRIGQIRDGLVGLTPYDVSDLVFDWRMKGTVAQVAVVARETLREAEAFATQYRFNPVSFVAASSNGDFDGEPFFGPTRLAASLLTGGETIEPDRVGILVLGAELKVPKPKPAPKPNPVPVPAPKPVATAPALAEASLAKPTPPPRLPPTAVEPPKPTVSFASRRANGSPSDAVTPVLDRVPPRIALTPQSAPSKAEPPKAPPPAQKSAKSTEQPIPAPTVAAQKPIVIPPPPQRPAMPVTAPIIADSDNPPAAPAAIQSQAKKPLQSAKTATSAIASTLGKLGRDTGKAARRQPAKEPEKPAKAPSPATQPRSARASVSEAEALTVFGARGHSPQRGKPRYLGLVMTLFLLLALAVLALWSTYFMSDITSGWFGTFDEDTVVAANVPEPAAPVIVPPAVAPARAPAPVIQSAVAPDPVPETAVTEPLTVQPTPDPVPDTTPDIASEPPASLEIPQSAIDAATALAEAAAPPSALAQTTPDIPVEVARLEQPQTEAPPPQLVAPAPVIRTPLSGPEAEARYAATGIWQLDPDPPELPGTDRLDDIYIASIDPNIGSQDALALPAAPALTDDRRPEALTPPVALGTTFDFDERGLVRATPEGALTPEGVPVFLGPPPTAAGPRPADLQVPEQDTRLETDRLQLIRPPLRPGDLSETNERARLGGFSIVELAAVRPTIRPPSIQEQALAAPPAQETVTALPEAPVAEQDTATALAVAASRAPPNRPSGFAALVDKALKEATRTAPSADAEDDDEPEAQVAAARVPSIPTRASVAKQATVTNAINLRKINLIGVYGSPSDRRALVRLPSGRYVKVKIGDRVDGGQVAAIGDNELRYVKSGRNITLKLPQG